MELETLSAAGWSASSSKNAASPAPALLRLIFERRWRCVCDAQDPWVSRSLRSVRSVQRKRVHAQRRIRGLSVAWAVCSRPARSLSRLQGIAGLLPPSGRSPASDNGGGRAAADPRAREKSCARAVGERAGRAGVRVRRRVGIQLTHKPTGLSRGWVLWPAHGQ